jgi:hypothetical protein
VFPNLMTMRRSSLLCRSLLASDLVTTVILATLLAGCGTTAPGPTVTPTQATAMPMATQMAPTQVPTTTPTETPTLTPTQTSTPQPTNTQDSTDTPLATPIPRPFWIRYRPSSLPLVECPDENPQEGILESSHPGCRVTNSFWAPDGHFWGPIVKDDNGNNVDFAPVGLASCVAHYKPDPCGPDSVEQMRVFAVDDGVVRNIDYLGDKIGWRILILHEGDMIGNYGHLADPRALVHVGQAVKAGQEIGSVSPSWDYFLAFSIFRKVDGYTIDYDPFDYGLAMDDLGD